MLRFVESIKKKYMDRLLVREQQWPPARGEKLINLQLVQTDKNDVFSGTTEGIERRSIAYHKLFSEKMGKKPVKKVLVEGHAGIGKTTLSLMLSEEWAQGNILKQFDLVLLLPLREKKVSCAESLPDLLKLLHSCEVIRTSVARELEEREGERVLIIADGWDELEETKRSKDSFLYDLLFGVVVPFASVLVTSRPSASSSLRKLSSVSRLVEVVGFDKENIKAFIESEFEDDPQKASGLLKQLGNNPILQSVCGVPLNCAIICYLWHTLKQELPSTMTGLYTQIILSVVYRDITKKFTEYAEIMSLSSFDSIPTKLQPYWWRICEFAYETISRNQIVFSKEELEVFLPEALTSDQTIFCFGLLQSSPSLLLVGHGLSFSFLHLTFQEYLAALHILTLPVEKQLEICQSNALTNHFSIVWRFFFGLLSVQTDGNHLSLCRKLNTSMDIEGMLTTYRFREDKLLLCHCAFEYRCSHVSSLVSVLINEERHEYFAVAHNALDCAAVCHILSHTEFCSSLLISMTSCGLGDKELKQLITPLSRAAGQLQVKKLDLSRNELSNTGISELFSVVPAAFSSLDTLHLNDNQIGFDGLKHAFFCLGYASCCNLRHLSLSNNPLGAAGFKELERAVLAGTLSNLYRLDLAITLTPDADTNGALLVALLEALATRCWGLTFLDISNNTLCIPGAQAVGGAICQLTQKVDVFDLLMNDTKLGDLGIIALIESINGVCSLNNLNIQRNAITGVGLSSLVEVMYSGKVSIEALDLSYNPLGCSGALLIMKMLSSDVCTVRQLSLTSCQLTTALTSTLDTASSNEVSLPYSDVFEHSQLSQKCYVTSLSLEGNSFTGEGIHCLAGLVYSCASSLRFLWTMDCQLTSEDLIQLLTLLHQLHSSHCCSKDLHTILEQWYLNDNNLNDDGVATLMHHIPSCFRHLRFVLVDGNRVSNSMRGRLEEQCHAQVRIIRKEPN